MLVGDVGPEAALAAALLAAAEHRHGRVVGPQHGRLQQQFFLPLVERPQQLSGRLYPIALGAASNVQAVTREEVFLTVERQVVAELGDDDLSDQSRSGDAAGDRSHRRRRARHAVLGSSGRHTWVARGRALRASPARTPESRLSSWPMRSLGRPQPEHCLSAALRSCSCR